MQIDVIVPTFNRAHTLERAVNSVLNQTYKNFILHIVDDGSTDGTEDLLEKYQRFRDDIRKSPFRTTILKFVAFWSHDRDLNPRPLPYHGSALPTELSRHVNYT